MSLRDAYKTNGSAPTAPAAQKKKSKAVKKDRFGSLLVFETVIEEREGADDDRGLVSIDANDVYEVEFGTSKHVMIRVETPNGADHHKVTEDFWTAMERIHEARSGD